MADYYSILKKTIASLPESNGAARRSVYSRARNAIVNQLKAYEPPLSPSEITSEQLRLEEAIRKVEAEAARASLGLEPTSSAVPTAPPAALPQAPEPAVPTVPAAAPEPTSYSSAPRVDAPAPSAEEAAPYPAAPVPQPSVETPASADIPPVQPSAEPVIPDPAPVAQEPSAPVVGEPARNEPVFSVDADDDSVFADNAGEDELASAGLTDPEPAPRASRSRPSASDALRDNEGGSRLVPMIAAAAAVVVVLGGAAYFFLASPGEGPSNETSAPVSQEPETAVVADPEPVVEEPVVDTRVVEPETDAGKNTDRLINESSDDVVAPDARTVTTTTINPEPSEPVSSGQPSIVTNVEGGAADGAAAPSSESGTPASEAVPQDSLAAVTPPAADPQPSVETPDTGVQRAILYEEGADPSAAGTAAQGAVVWELGNEIDLSGQEQSVLSATVEIPERDVKVDIRIKPNDDTSLPASHLVEIKYVLPDSFAAGDIVNVPGLVMKPTEEARGDALIGASVKVSPGFFWIALSSLPNEQQRNMALLRERGWIDIPMLYENGKRGILTLEKGPVGTDAVEKAVASWRAG